MHEFALRHWAQKYVLPAAAVLLAAMVISCGATPVSAPTQSLLPTSPVSSPVTLPATVPPAPPPSSAPPSAPATTAIEHVVLVVEENKDFSDVIGSSDMPYLNSLAQQNAVARNYFANGVDSLPNYFMLAVGDTVAKDASFTGTVSEDNVVRQLLANKKTWKAYAETLPSVGYVGADQPPYVMVHNPFAYISDVLSDAAQTNNLVPFSQFAADLASGTLPNYAFIIPNNSSNSHDCPSNMANCTLSDTLRYADNWLKTNLVPLLANSTFQQHGLLIVTWDESRTDTTANGGGHVATVLAGPDIKPGFQSSTMYQHQSTLRLMMRVLGVKSYPNQASSAPEMDEFFNKPLP